MNTDVRSGAHWSRTPVRIALRCVSCRGPVGPSSPPKDLSALRQGVFLPPA